jgi:HAAS domain-containing protein
MPDTDIAVRMMEDYLKHLRGALRRLPEGEARDIVEEIRSHLRDSADRDGVPSAEKAAAALERLGSPLELATKYRMGSLAERAQRTRSPWLALRTIFHWAGLSLNGVWVLLVSLVGYTLAASFLIAAAAKPFNPQRVGLWRLDDPQDSWSLHLGFRAAPQGAEVLGWWMVPLGLLVGVGLFLLTARFGVRSLARFRSTLTLPGR